ncbi:hypothetical protein ACMA1D_12805 [Streptomyces sp. 796.1]|uniref:hypothetical protein n=1 Tax=Streptomyces sp. 796.1 TaxID=3163029 RepID=UPI0039C99004
MKDTLTGLYQQACELGLYEGVSAWRTLPRWCTSRVFELMTGARLPGQGDYLRVFDGWAPVAVATPALCLPAAFPPDGSTAMEAEDAW